MEVAALEHGEDCACTRCVGFERGNQLARRHGGYSLGGIGERAAEIVDEIRPTLPAYSAADEPVLCLLGTTLARIERANRALDQVDDQAGDRPARIYLIDDALKLARLRDDLRAWVGLARRLAADLGLTPTSRARLGLDIAAARRTLSLIELYAEEAER